MLEFSTEGDAGADDGANVDADDADSGADPDFLILTVGLGFGCGVSCWCPPTRARLGSGDCTALRPHGSGELSTCLAPERSLDWPEVPGEA